ncbi:MAG: GntR family transcriptional regulator, partial [Chloroflexi bacterium]|nr:GntR family transcriptional regulator [Chloroflexota bacterium]
MNPARSSSLRQVDVDNTDASVLLRDIAYERIKEAIRMGELRPGQPLAETKLSKLLGISRTPVREALQMLVQEGLVQSIPGQAVTVAAPSIHAVMDAIHVRWLLEPEVVRLAARSISSEQLGILQDTLKELNDAVASDDRAAWSAADNVFHET